MSAVTVPLRADLAVIRDDLPLAPRMLDQLRCLAEGMTMEEAARELWVGLETVKRQRRIIYLRLGARNAAHAVHLAHERGILG